MAILTAFAGLTGILLLINGVSSTPPNIVMVFADDMGWNDVPWHNNYVQMPHLQDLANNGIILDNAYAQQLCTPSRAAFLTGRYPINIGMQEGTVGSRQTNGLPISLKLLPQYLKEAPTPYATHMFGKWHLGYCDEAYTPTRRGFDSHYGFYHGHIGYYDHLSAGFLDYRDNLDVNTAATGIYSTEDFTNQAISAIDAHNDPNTPMFLYMAYNAPHGPFEVNSTYTDLYPEVDGQVRGIYLGMVSAMDDQINRLVNALKDNNMWSNTLFVFYSDNGGAATSRGHAGNNYPLRGRKNGLYEGGYKVPAMIHSPDLLPNVGYTYTGLVHITDMFTVFLDLAGATGPAETDGVNVWNAILTDGSSPRTEVVYNVIRQDRASAAAGTVVEHAALRDGNFKIIEGDPGSDQTLDGWIPPAEDRTDLIGAITNYGPYDDAGTPYYLFDLDADPEETNNLAATRAGKFRQMKRKLNAWKRQVVQAIASDTSTAALPGVGGSWDPGFCTAT